MLLGMSAQYAFNRFERPKNKRPEFDWGLFIAPIFASPIIFLPLLAALQTAQIDLANLTIPKMILLVFILKISYYW